MGKDPYGRCFFVFKLNYKAKKNQTILYDREKKHLINEKKQVTNILFERRYGSDCWVFGEPYYNYIFYDTAIANENAIENIIKLINGNTIETNNFSISF